MSDLSQAAARGLSRHRQGLLLVVGGVFLWSIGGLLARLIDADPWTTLFWRSLFACAFLLVYVAVRSKGQVIGTFRQLGWPGVIVGTCFAIGSTCFLNALAYTTVANVLFMQALSPFLAGLLAWLLMRERIAGRTIVAMLAALLGIGIMVFGSIAAGHGIGDLLAILMATALACAIVTMRRHHDIQMAPAACIATGLAALWSFLPADPGIVPAGDFVYLLIFGVLQMGVGLILFTAGTRLIPAAESALLTVLESVLAPLWVWLALSEVPSASTMIGGGIALAALVTNTMIDWRGTRDVTPPV
jgi:drug/metabolite transporter (DMT)-like permease